MTQPNIFDAILALIQTWLPGFRVVSKQNSKLHRAIGWALHFPWIFGWAINRNYMEHYWTTIGQTAAHPTELPDLNSSYDILLHEQQHACQSKRWHGLFGPLYLLGTPVPFIMFALISVPFWFWIWWIGLSILAFGLILSSPVPFGRFRAVQEYEAFEFTLAIHYWTVGSINDATKSAIAQEFTSPSYFFMHPNKKAVRRKIDKMSSYILSGAILLKPKFRQIHDLLKQHGKIA